LKFEDLSQILWAGQGVTHPAGFRTAPSAGATYPLNLYAVVGEVEKISPGLYQYQPQSHSLVRILAGDLRKSLARASLGQKWVELAPVNLVITALYSRITPRYGKRGIRYAQIEVGHIGENIYLQAEALKIGTVAVGAFDDEEVKKILSLSSEEVPLYIMPLGYQKKK
jgi:SagB-type dehydrogenase family enzyme